MNENAKWIVAAAAALLVGACAVQTTMPSAEQKLALAPTGKLRVAFLANNAAQATKDPVSGELKGPAVDLGRQLAVRLDVPFEAVPYRTVAEMVASAPNGEWDVISLGINPDREKLIDFAAPYSQTESGYLVKGSAISTMADVDRPGIRIAVLERGDSDIFLTKSLKHAQLIRTKSVAEAVELLKSGSADVHANIKTFLIPLAGQVPTGRLLEGYWQIQPIALGVPKGKEAGARYVRQAVDELKAQGFVRQSIERAAVPGLMPAP